MLGIHMFLVTFLVIFFLQVESIKKISEYVSQLRRVGKGHGMYITTIIFHIGPQTLPYT